MTPGGYIRRRRRPYFDQERALEEECLRIRLPVKVVPSNLPFGTTQRLPDRVCPECGCHAGHDEDCSRRRR